MRDAICERPSDKRRDEAGGGGASGVEGKSRSLFFSLLPPNGSFEPKLDVERSAFSGDWPRPYG